MLAVEIAFWASVVLLVHTHVTYPVSLWLLARARRPRPARPAADRAPSVSLIVAAHDEQAVIERKVANALALDYPRDRLEVIVASDGSSDRTAPIAREAGADLVLELPRVGKVEAQNAAVERSRGEEGAYWRYEMAVRELESRLAGITAGNGAIYATRRDAYIVLDSARGHDLSFPFAITKRGWRALYAPDALAEEKMAPTIGGEFARKRRMMSRTWGVVLRDGMLSPRGYGPLYSFQMISHRALRYASPFLHLLALGTNLALLGHGAIYTVTLAIQAGAIVAAALGAVIPIRPLRLAHYYAMVEGSILAGLWDRLRSRTAVTWEKVEGTR